MVNSHLPGMGWGMGHFINTNIKLLNWYIVFTYYVDIHGNVVWQTNTDLAAANVMCICTCISVDPECLVRPTSVQNSGKNVSTIVFHNVLTLVISV